MRVYLAAPIVGISDEWKLDIEIVENILSKSDIEVFNPRKHGVANAWGMSHEEWGRAIFAQDTLMIKDCDWIVACDFGRGTTSGTSWEVGYGFGIGKKILQVIMREKDTDYSVMMRGCSSNYVTLADLETTPNYKLWTHVFVERGRVDEPEIELN